MKKILILTFIWFALISCDNRFDFIAGYNHAPVLSLTATGNNTATTGSLPQGSATNSGNNNTITLLDSVKTSFKHGAANYTFTVNISDVDVNISSISAAITSGMAKVQMNGSDIPTVIPAKSGPLEFTLSQFSDGQIDFVVTITDQFKSTANFKLTLVAFKNLSPVAGFTYAQNNINSDPYQYAFDATKCYDKDQRFGGGIQAYSWVVNGKTLPPITNPIMNWVFPNPGGYQVSLYAIDNDGTSSSIVTQQITVK
jgi:hypothetical protein